MAMLTREQIVTIEVLQQRGQSQSPDGADPRRLRGGGPVPPPPRPRRGDRSDGRSRRGSSNSAWPRSSPTGGRPRPRSWASSGRPASSSSTSSSAPSTATTARTSRSASSCGPATAGRRSARSGGSRPRPGPRPRATGASSAGSTSATPTGRRRSTPSSWSSATAARRPSSGAARWTSSPGTTSTTRRTAGSAAWPRSTGSTTSRPASRGAAAPGEQINEQYRVYARTMGFHVDACEVRSPEQKGKTERRVGDCKGLDVQGRRFDGLAGLQAWTDADRAARAIKRICPATGLSVADELGGGEAVPAAAAGAAARAVRPGQDGAGAQGLHGPFRGPQLYRPVHLCRPRRWRSAAARDACRSSTRRPPRCWSRTRGTPRSGS